MTTVVAPRADPVAEGAQIAQAADAAGLDLRLVGGVGVALRCPSAASPPLSRTYEDVGRGQARCGPFADRGVADRLRATSPTPRSPARSARRSRRCSSGWSRCRSPAAGACARASAIAFAGTEAAELQELRLALETAAACRLARRWSPEALAMLEKRLAFLRGLNHDNSNLAERMAADLAFHEGICEAAGNATLLEMWRSLIGRTTIMALNVGEQRMSRLQDADTHRPLLEAISSGDDEIIRETFARVFDSGTAVVIEAVGHADDTLDVA